MATDDEKWKRVDDAVAKAKMISEGDSPRFTTKENIEVFNCVYNICWEKGSFLSNPRKVYEKFRNYLAERIQERVVPSLEGKSGAALLTKIIQLWSEYKVFTSCLFKFFLCLDTVYLGDKKVPRLDDISRNQFRVMVCDKLYTKLQESLMTMIIEERDGKETDRGLLKTTLEFLRKVKGNYYEKFEQALLAETAAHYSKLGSECWFWRDSFTNYLRKVDWCFSQEENRADVYPCKKTKTKLLEVVKYILLHRNAKKWAQSWRTEELAAEDQELLSKYSRLNLEEDASKTKRHRTINA